MGIDSGVCPLTHGKEPDMATRTKQTTAEPTPEPTRAPCLCGCGESPRGKRSRFVPGHDARYHAAQKKAAAEAAK